MPDFTRLLAIGLLNYADDHGFFWANPMLVRGALFPFDEDSSKLRRSLAQLASEGFIRLGKTVDGRECGHVVNFSKHQRVDKPKDSSIQPLIKFDDESKTRQRLVVDESPLDRKGSDQGSGIGSGNGSLAAPPAPQVRNLFIDVLAEIEGTPLAGITTAVAKRLATALKEIREATPGVTPEEIRRRAGNYTTHFEASITASALAKWWGRCEVPGLNIRAPGIHGKVSSMA